MNPLLNLNPDVSLAKLINDFLAGKTGHGIDSMGEFRYMVKAMQAVTAGAAVIKDEELPREFNPCKPDLDEHYLFHQGVASIKMDVRSSNMKSPYFLASG